MGEATYYAKIYFDDLAKAGAALPAVRAFFQEGARAANFWQDNREWGKDARPPALFWTAFKEKFPVVSDYLETSGKFGGDYNNGLAGHLDFGEELEVDDNLTLNDGVLFFHAYVWHFAQWDGLADFVGKKWGGKMKWLSDEYVDFFDLL